VNFAICNELFEGWDFSRVCRFVKSVGYDGVELAPFTLAPRITDLTPAELQALRRTADEAGVAIVGFHWLFAKTSGMHLTSPDAAVRERLGDYLVALGRACRALGGRVLVFGSPRQRSLPVGVSHAQGMSWAADTFRRVMPALDELDVTLCMEPLSTAETDFVTTCAQAAELVEMVGHRRCVIHLDVKAMSTEAAPVPDLIRRYAGRAGHFHANDPNLRGPGFGTTDFAPIFQALDDAGYRGWISVEVFDYSPDPETVARESIDYMRRVRS
jgi:sugar phosphate isomerase/epimerase